MTRVVAMGGGTGLATLLRGVKPFTDSLTGIVTMADDGGSSGRLRRELGVLPPGDVRNCLVALADDESLMRRLFDYRFENGSLAGHSFGNLFLAALSEVTGNFEQAVLESSRVLAIRGSVLPSTTTDVRLGARLRDGSHIFGQSVIAKAQSPIQQVWLEPTEAPALPLALERIRQAELVVLGPGSLYTSVVPNLLVGGMAEALRETRARVVFVNNVMTQPGETQGYDAEDHLRGILSHLGEGVIDVMLVNDRPIPGELLALYEREGAEPVTWGPRSEDLGVRVVSAPLADVHRFVRHDSCDLARTLLALAG
ncbi:MAG TPA: gluconeogenesis factor YvcK family protein [Thermoleophilia bacterium]|nr:gluconeogenesis factor YvcK family protein [Thermoleophilia bacterium]